MRPRLAARHSVCSSPRSFALLTEYRLVSFPPLTKIFQFRGCSLLSKLFGNPGFKACVRLPRAFRNLLRPSSLFEPNHPLSGSSNYSLRFLLFSKHAFASNFLLLPHGFMKTKSSKGFLFYPPFHFQTPSATKETSSGNFICIPQQSDETSLQFFSFFLFFLFVFCEWTRRDFPNPRTAQNANAFRFFCSKVFLNPRPRACKARALPLRHEPPALNVIIQVSNFATVMVEIFPFGKKSFRFCTA